MSWRDARRRLSLVRIAEEESINKDLQDEEQMEIVVETNDAERDAQEEVFLCFF